MRIILATLALLSTGHVMAGQESVIDVKSVHSKNELFEKSFVDQGIAAHLGLSPEKYNRLKKYISGDRSFYVESGITPLNEDFEYYQFFENYNPNDKSTFHYKEDFIKSYENKEKLIAEYIGVPIHDLRQVVISYVEYRSLIDSVGNQGVSQMTELTETKPVPTFCGPLVQVNIPSFDTIAASVEIAFAFSQSGLGEQTSHDYMRVQSNSGAIAVFQKNKFTSVPYKSSSYFQKNCT